MVIVSGENKGRKIMAKNLAVENLLQQHYNKGKLVAAICADIKLELQRFRTHVDLVLQRSDSVTTLPEQYGIYKAGNDDIRAVYAAVYGEFTAKKYG